MKFLPVNVYKTEGVDCSANGVTHTMPRKLVVCCTDGYLSREDVDKHGYQILDYDNSRVNGRPGHFRPRGGEGWHMNGGNFVYSSDSRFGQHFGHSPIAVHDRVEG